jgi:cytochrome c-type biogenesis protein CcmH
MTLWLILVLMTAVAIFAVLWPLSRHAGAARSGSDIAVYRDQLNEIERDLAAGLIGKTEAEAARVEVSRRLLAAADAAADATQTTSSASNATSATWRRRAVAVVSLLLLPVGTSALYLRLGSPGMASEPLAARRNVQPGQQPSIENLVSQAEVHLERNPKDGRGWEILAPVYMRLGRYTDSVNAWRNALQLLGESADREANLGEALMAAANGIVTADSKAAFVRAVSLDSKIVSGRYYLGVAAEQDGKREQAAKIWRDLIAEAPAGAHWVSDVRSALARVEGKTAAAPPGPSIKQMATAARQLPAQQAAMIRRMVDGLAARLKNDGSDLDGWVRLVRSYNVLGEPDKARAAVTDAHRAFAGDPDKLQKLDAALKSLERGASTAAAAPSPAAQPATPGVTAAAAPPLHQDEQIRGMVDRLASRLKKSGSDPEGWLMLTRSYLTLGEKDKAMAAISDARKALANEPAKLQLFNAALKRFKVGETADAAAAMPAPAAAEARPPDPTTKMIRGMVARLADRLKQDGSDFDGWQRLVRSYVVLGERDKALSAAADARRAIGTDADKRRRFDEFVKSLGLEG